MEKSEDVFDGLLMDSQVKSNSTERKRKKTDKCYCNKERLIEARREKSKPGGLVERKSDPWDE